MCSRGGTPGSGARKRLLLGIDVARELRQLLVEVVERWLVQPYDLCDILIDHRLRDGICPRRGFRRRASLGDDCQPARTAIHACADEIADRGFRRHQVALRAAGPGRGAGFLERRAAVGGDDEVVLEQIARRDAGVEIRCCPGGIEVHDCGRLVSLGQNKRQETGGKTEDSGDPEDDPVAVPEGIDECEGRPVVHAARPAGPPTAHDLHRVHAPTVPTHWTIGPYAETI